MSKNYDDYKPINPMPPRRRKNPGLTFIQYSIIILLVVALAVSGAYFMALHNSNDGQPQQPENTEPPVEQPEEQPGEESGDNQGAETQHPEPDNELPPSVVDIENYEDVLFSADAIHKGSLIYVGENNKVVYPAADELASFLGAKTNSYQISSNTMMINKDIIDNINSMMDAFFAETGKNDVIVWTGYRDEARQTQVYNEYVAKFGEEAAKTAVSKPGESDHHTALGIVLKVYRNGTPYEFSQMEGYSWIEENCYKYGFVVRYPENKQNVTGIDYSSTCYLRYVGVPHAEYMVKNDKCLEEYLILLKDYTFGNVHFDYTMSDGTVYESYYVKAEVDFANNVFVPVPRSGEYTISGNNMDGFIVTVKK